MIRLCQVPVTGIRFVYSFCEYTVCFLSILLVSTGMHFVKYRYTFPEYSYREYAFCEYIVKGIVSRDFVVCVLVSFDRSDISTHQEWVLLLLKVSFRIEFFYFRVWA
jgi:hypothetical protein